jgi:hypothetical protein
MIDTSIVRVHQHAACIARNRSQSMVYAIQQTVHLAAANETSEAGRFGPQQSN